MCVHMQNNVKVCKTLFKHRAQNLQKPTSKPSETWYLHVKVAAFKYHLYSTSQRIFYLTPNVLKQCKFTVFESIPKKPGVAGEREGRSS